MTRTRIIAASIALALATVSSTAKGNYFIPDASMSISNASNYYQSLAQFSPSNVIDGNITEPPYASEGGSGYHEWLADNGTLANFTLNLGAKYPISQIDLYNTHNGTYNDRGTENFHILAGNAVDGNGALNGRDSKHPHWHAL